MSYNHHEEEAFYHFTMMDFVELVEQYGDRVWAELERYSPTVYEAFCAYKANQDVEDFITKDVETRWNDGCDYWKDEAND